jgi:ABC transport system ATP-binding/permease protein
MSLAFLVVQGSSGTQTQHPIVGSLTIGRSQAADLALSDPSVSRKHASLRLDGATVVIEDLDSANGTFVNGEQIADPVRLESGDVIVLGSTELELRVETAEAQAASTATPTEIHPPRR